MFTTVDKVKEVTGYDVDADLIKQAQALVEIYIGKVEAEIDDARDKRLLSHATAYQAAYMRDNYHTVFEQMPVAQQAVAGSVMTFRSGDKASPYISGPTQIACDKLSWRRGRSIRVGKTFDKKTAYNWWTD